MKRQRTWVLSMTLVSVMLHGLSGRIVGQEVPTPPPRGEFLSVGSFLPRGHVTDGSVSYQKQIQEAIDAAAGMRRVLVFPAMVYQVHEEGLRLHSGSILWMEGAIFQLGKDCKKDGQVFLGEDVQDVQLRGGQILGRNDAWPEGINIRGVYLKGKVSNIRISGMRMQDLSSNGIGIFGDPKSPARDIWVSDTMIENSCNRYGDYLSEKVGPEKDSVRADQGLVAFYHVRDFVVRGCRLDRSRSDGTHFFRCGQGMIVQCQVTRAQMGGYFLETCEEVVASDNLFRDNGSRGVTIERGSRSCILRGNVVRGSGREGLWAPDCSGLIVTGNVFDRNGRKPNGDRPGQIWNANITVNESLHDPTDSPTRDYLIANNIVTTTAGQIAAIRVDAVKGMTGIVVKDNLLRGENRRIAVEGEGREQVILRNNE